MWTTGVYRWVTILEMPDRIGPRKPVRLYLAEWREHFGLTQEKLGERIGENGVSKATVSRWESNPNPTAGVLAAYAEALGKGTKPGDLWRHPQAGRTLDSQIADLPTDKQQQVIEFLDFLHRKAS